MISKFKLLGLNWYKIFFQDQVDVNFKILGLKKLWIVYLMIDLCFLLLNSLWLILRVHPQSSLQHLWVRSIIFSVCISFRCYKQDMLVVQQMVSSLMCLIDIMFLVQDDISKVLCNTFKWLSQFPSMIFLFLVSRI